MNLELKYKQINNTEPERLLRQKLILYIERTRTEREGDYMGMKILVACEESQAVCKAFRELGHEAYSCLWLKGLYQLKPTNIVEPEIIHYKNGKGTDNPWHMRTINLSPHERAKERSKTFTGIAKAMAEQWGKEGTQ